MARGRRLSDVDKQMDARTATRQTGLLSLVIMGALAATAFVAGYAILVVFASLLDGSGILRGQ